MAFARAGFGTTGAGAAEAFARVMDVAAGTGSPAARAVGAGHLRGRTGPEISVFLCGTARPAHVVTRSLRP
ncbi:hypothetical protein [Nonomuraea maritima]|uniref:hypothetical protein n=1 Tax=Nonomuraea maritima TaxID=683260 RepID=UPI0037179CFC